MTRLRNKIYSRCATVYRIIKKAFRFLTWCLVGMVFVWALCSPEKMQIALVLGVFGGIVSMILYYATRRRISKRKMVKIWLLISCSPVILFFLLVIGIWGYSYYQRKHEFTDKERLERITGMEYPDFKVARYIHGNTAFNGDYYDELVIEFEETPPGNFYRHLDSLATVKGSHWSKRNGGGYSFNYSWGNGSPAPEGENEQDDMFIRIELEKGKKRARIEYGVW